MKISIQEFKELVSLLREPIKIEIDRTVSSITIAVKVKEDDTLVKPLVIENVAIRKLGIYDINKTKVWIVKA